MRTTRIARYGLKRVHSLFALTAAAFALIGLLAFAQAATAATGFGKVASFGKEEFAEGPGAVAVNQSSGDVYVVDHGNNLVRRYDANGENELSWAVPAPAGVAVSSAGTVYVASNPEGEVAVREFDVAGKAEGEVKETEAGEPFTGLSGIAVDKEGHLWVEQSTGEVDRFDGSKETFTAEAPCTGAFAVDEAEHLYLPIGCGVEQFSLQGEDLGQADPNFVAGVTAEPTTNDVFANDGFQVSIYNEKREPITTFGSGVLSGCSAGIAINHASQHVYVADPCNGLVFIFAQVTLPAVSINAPSAVNPHGATFSGTVNPEGEGEPHQTKWAFETSTDGGSSWSRLPEHAQAPGTSPVATSEAVALKPGVNYQVRLEATDAGGTSDSTAETFATEALAPTLSGASVEGIASTQALFKGVLNPENAPTTYWFEYGTTSAYGSSVPAAQNAEAGAGSTFVGVMRPVYGLAPSTTYHFRLAARNETGTSRGEDQTFTTITPAPPAGGCANEASRDEQRSTFLPDCRAYEMVSPALKNGGDVVGDSSRVHVATTESPGLPMAASFSALTGFGDVQGLALTSEYLSERDARPGTGGWSAHSITPPESGMSIASAAGSLEALYMGELSGDLTTGVLQSASDLTSEPNVARVENLYARGDLRTPGTGAYGLLTPCLPCASTNTPLPHDNNVFRRSTYAGASADLSHVIFESPHNLTSDASGTGFKLYEAVNGNVRMFTGPANAGCAGADPCSAAGAGAAGFLAPRTISANGSRVLFTSPVSGSQDTIKNGTGEDASKIYQFDDRGTADPGDDTTVQVNSSERTDCAGDPTCGGDGIPDPAPDTPQPAAYQNASADGSRVFFTTDEQLTDDAPQAGSSHLYMWTRIPDAQGHHLTLLDRDVNANDGIDSGKGVIGSSDDGHFVYFVADGQLLDDPALPLGQPSIYLWHDDGATPVVAFIGYLATATDSTANLNPRWNILPKVARVTPDGRHLLFEASDGSGLTGYDHGTCPVVHGLVNSNGSGDLECSEAYVYSADAHSLACASCNPSGAPATANVFVTNSSAYRTGSGSSGSTTHLGRAISDDGRRVFFSTAEALVPEDVNGKVDVYEYDVPDHSLHLISSGRDSADSWFMDASPSGNDAFFITRERLVGWDVDESYDLYDARVGGGFPNPPPAAVACSGESCQGQLAQAPGALAPGSLSLLSADNLNGAANKPPQLKPCKRGFVRRRVRGKVRCVKRHGRPRGHRGGR